MKKQIALIVSFALLHLILAQPVAAAAKEDKLIKQAAKVRLGIEKIGAGREAFVKLKLRDNTKLAGYVSEASADTFVVTDPKTGTTTTVAYTNVTQVKGHNLSTGAKIAIGVGIVVAVFLIIFIVARCNNEPGSC